MEKSKKVYKRLGIDLPIALHRDLKEMAAKKRGINMSRYVTRLIVSALKGEHLFD